ncbi:MAG: hypothetical protein DIU69_00555 [Bacillota bacterium]|nr:MAG: hypothetical protein DIU69_00555 [Bacillota bacterium]
MTVGVACMNRRRFWMAAAAGYLALAVVLATLIATGTVFAAFPLSGIGGFVVAADRIEGTGFSLTPALDNTSEQGIWPQGAVQLAEVKIRGLNLSKELSIGTLRAIVEISAEGTVNGTGVTMNISGMKADRAEFSEMKIDENYSTNVLQKIGLTADSMLLTKPEMNTHMLVTRSITLPNMKLKIKVYNGDDYVGGDF